MYICLYVLMFYNFYSWIFHSRTFIVSEKSVKFTWIVNTDEKVLYSKTSEKHMHNPTELYSSIVIYF